jgi:hypothetical protein
MVDAKESIFLTVIENPLLDITIDDNDSILINKHSLQHG